MRELPFSCFLPWPRPAWEAAELKKGGGGGRVGGGGCGGGGGGADPGRAVIRQAERKTTSGTQSGTPPSSSFLQTPSIMSKLSCGSKYSLHSVGFEVANRRYCCLPSSLFFLSSSPVEQEPSDSKRSTCVPLKSIYFKPWFPSLLLQWENNSEHLEEKGGGKSTHHYSILYRWGFLCKLGLSRDPHQLSL